MSSADPALPETAARWPDRSRARRVEGLAGEMRVNLIRLAALLVFYGHHLLNVLVFRDDPLLAGRYHTAVTAVALAWSLTVLAIHLFLSLRRVRPWLSLAAMGADTIFITLLLCLSGDARSTLAGLYFLVIASAGVRLSLPLVYAATLGSMAGYGIFLAYGHLRFDAGGLDISRPAQVIFLLALGTAGLLTGQMVRQARRLARADAARRFCPCCNEPLPALAEPAAEAKPTADAETSRDNMVVGIGLVLLGVLLGIALFWPASNDNLDPDALVGLTFGLVLLVVTGTILQLRRKDLPPRSARGGLGGTAFAGMAFILVLAMLIALAIAILKTYF